jgi:hypothetical protein
MAASHVKKRGGMRRRVPQDCGSFLFLKKNAPLTSIFFALVVCFSSLFYSGKASAAAVEVG